MSALTALLNINFAFARHSIFHQNERHLVHRQIFGEKSLHFCWL